MPILYDRAFGGSDDKHPDENKHSAYMPNPVGRGYHANISHDLMDGAPSPNTEERGRSIGLPADFDTGYYQAAPVDQQIDHLNGNEVVELVNLTRNGRTVFRLPKKGSSGCFLSKEGRQGGKADSCRHLGD